MVSWIFLGAIELIIFIIGINIHPFLMVLIPISLLILWWLINHPAVTLMFMSLTAIVKGYLVSYISIFQVLDVTVIITIIIWLGLIKIVLNDEWKLSKDLKAPVYLFLLFGILLCLSFIYTPSPGYGLRKILRFNTFGLTMFITPLIVVKTSEDSKRLLTYFKYLIIIIIGIVLFQFVYFLNKGSYAIVLAYWNRISIPGANPIQVSRYLAIGAAMVITLLIRNKPTESMHYFVILFTILLSIILSGSRGPLLSVIIGIIFYAFMYERKNIKRIYSYGILAIGLVIIILVILPENLTQRFINLTEGSIILTQQGVKQISTIATRLEFWSMSLKAWFSSIPNFFFGLGVGGFSSLFIWRDWRWYPHNLFFEIIAEIGLIGLLIMLAFLRKFFKAINLGFSGGSFTEHSALWVAGTFVIFFAAQFSGDFNDNRILWMLIGITMASTYADKADEIKNQLNSI
ncbi:MAG: O-antigen ligase family protein [Fidelibacterota bacterium]